MPSRAELGVPLAGTSPRCFSACNGALPRSRSRFICIYHQFCKRQKTKHLEKAIKVYPNQPLIRKALFKSHWVAGRREEAKDQLIELLDRFHDSYGSCHFAEMYFLMGKEERAYHWLQKAIDAKESFV